MRTWSIDSVIDDFWRGVAFVVDAVEYWLFPCPPLRDYDLPLPNDDAAEPVPVVVNNSTVNQDDVVAQLCQLTYFVEDIRNLLASLIPQISPAGDSCPGADHSPASVPGQHTNAKHAAPQGMETGLDMGATFASELFPQHTKFQK